MAQAPSRSSRLDPEFVAAHDAALRHARMWFPPDTAIKDADLGVTALAADGFREDADVECRFKVEGVGGATPKFTCVLPDGDDIKIKYGAANAEVYTEVLATRLLNTLGFPADRMYPVHRVRCFGCPADPFRQLQCLNDGVSKQRCFPDVDYKHFVDFPSAVVERSVSGRRIETEKERGWAWRELTKVDHSIGGASPAEVDAFRLLAVFLGHWDNKAKNQRLLCLGEAKRDEKAVAGSPSCERPVAMVQDVGATFGPEKLDLTRWSATPIWRDVARCVVSMRTLPYGGSTFPDAQISEAGRLFLADLLTQLSVDQIRSLFAGARIASYPHPTPAGRDINNWVKAFRAKVHAIADRPACPA